MRRSGRVLCSVVGFVVLGGLAPLAAPAGADERLDLMKQGKESFAAQCLGCHQTVEEAAAGYRNRPSWEQIVADMVTRGAKLDAKQQAAVVEYIAGRMLLVSKCSGCHTYNRPLTTNKTVEDWKATVERMARNIPAATRPSAEQLERLAAYLAVERPK